MRDALSLTDQAIAFGSGQLQEAAVRLMLGSVDRSYVFRLIEALALGDGKTVVDTSETLRLNGLSAASTLEEMSTVLQRKAVLQTLAQSAGAEIGATDGDSDPDAADTARLATLLPADETQLLYSICLHGRADLGLAPDEYAALTMVLLRLLAFKPRGAKPPAEKKTLDSPVITAPLPKATASVVTRPPVPEVVIRRPAPNPAPVPCASVEVVVPVAVQPWEDAPTKFVMAVPPGHVLHVRESVPPTFAVDTPDSELDDAESDAAYEPFEALAPIQSAQVATKIVAVPVRAGFETRADASAMQLAPLLIPTEDGSFWHATVQRLVVADAINAMVRELALQSQLIARDTDQWILRVERESLNQPGTRDRLAAALQSAGFEVTLVVEIGRVSDSPSRRNAAASADKQLAAEKIISNDPFVQSMMRDFGAKIVPGTLKPL